MLKNISKYFSPELLAAIYRMGHGDEIVLADAHFPGHSVNSNVIRADGIEIEQLLEAILPLFPIDNYVNDSIVMMEEVSGDTVDLSVAENYTKIIQKLVPEAHSIVKIERFAFYTRAKSAFAVVMSGGTKKYGNIILKKGVVSA
jgi:L-fucose mutarotase